MFKKLLDEGTAGDNVGLLLRGVERHRAWQVISSPADHAAHEIQGRSLRFDGRKKAGRHTPFLPAIGRSSTSDDGRDGVAHLPQGVEIAMPGDNVQMEIELIAPIAMEKGLRFARFVKAAARARNCVGCSGIDV